MYFRLLGTNGFHIRQRMKDFLLRACVVVRTSNMKTSRCRLTEHIKKLHQKVRCTCSTINISSFNQSNVLHVQHDYFSSFNQSNALHVQHDYFSSFNQSNHWFVTFSLLLPLPSSNLKLANSLGATFHLFNELRAIFAQKKIV